MAFAIPSLPIQEALAPWSAASSATTITASTAAARPSAAAATTAVVTRSGLLAAFTAITVKVLFRFVGALVPAFKGHASAGRRTFRSLFAAAHLGALLLQDGLARQLNAIAVDGQYLHQHLIAFLQLVANIVDAMLGDFADVQAGRRCRE